MPSKKFREEGLSLGILYRTHQRADPSDSPLQVLPLEMEQHPQASICQLWIPIGYFSKDADPMGPCLHLGSHQMLYLLPGNQVGPQVWAAKYVVKI